MRRKGEKKPFIKSYWVIIGFFIYLFFLLRWKFRDSPLCYFMVINGLIIIKDFIDFSFYLHPPSLPDQ